MEKQASQDTKAVKIERGIKIIDWFQLCNGMCAFFCNFFRLQSSAHFVSERIYNKLGFRVDCLWLLLKRIVCFKEMKHPLVDGLFFFLAAKIKFAQPRRTGKNANCTLFEYIYIIFVPFSKQKQSPIRIKDHSDSSLTSLIL